MGRLKNDAIAMEDRRQAAATLGDVAAAGHTVLCWCNRCGHNSEIDARTLIARLGPGMPVPEIGPRMRCSGCGSKDVATQSAGPAPGLGTGDDGGPDERRAS